MCVCVCVCVCEGYTQAYSIPKKSSMHIFPCVAEPSQVVESGNNE